MNAAFEDCVVLDECLQDFPQDRERAFAEYFRRRKENVDALADLAIDNFIEMRDKTASKTFRAKKKLDHATRSRAARNLSAALHDGDVYANALRDGGETRSHAKSHRIRGPHRRCAHHRFVASSFHRSLNNSSRALC